MRALQVEAVLLRNLLPDVPLRPGTVLMARVGERSERFGLLMLAGTALSAELPEQVRTGDRLRLVVQESPGDKVVLKITEPPAPPAQAAPGVASLPLPGGKEARVEVAEREETGRRGGAEESSVVLRYESPALGLLELRVALDPAAASVQVRAGVGRAHGAASDNADALRDALARALGRPAAVTVSARRDPLDVYA